MSKLYVNLDIQRFAAVGEVSYSVLSQNASTNTSVVRVTFTVRRTSGSTYFSDYKTATIRCDGQVGYASINLPSNKTSNSCYYDFTVTHGSDGAKYIEYSGTVTTGVGTFSASGNAWLPTIPRYANITSFSVAKRDETSVFIYFTTDATCDWVWASIDNGATWFNAGGNGSTIGGLNAGTSYNFKIKVRRQDSQLTKESGTYTQSTYDYPKPTEPTDFVIGSGNGNVNLYNPLSRQVTLQVISNVDNSVIASYSGTGSGSMSSIFNTTTAIDNMYQTIPNSISGTYYVKVTYLDSVKTSANKTYTINSSDCSPQMSVVTYEDIDATTLALTGDDQKLINGYSTIQVTIPANNKATARKYATIVGYKLENGSNSTDVISEVVGEDVVLTLTATSNIINVYAIDSRGQSGLYQIANVTLIDYTPLEKNTNPIAQRCDSGGQPNGVGEYVKISLGGKYWNQSFGDVTNSIQSITYQYKNNKSSGDPTTGTTTITATTSNDTFSISQLILGDTTHGFNIQNTYTIWVTIQDKLSSATFVITLTSGTPTIAYADDGICIKGQYNTSNGGKLQIEGQNITTIIRDMFYPVGKLYLTVGNEDPNQTIGGTWTKLSGYYLYADTTVNNTTYTGKNTQAHTLTAAQIPSVAVDIVTARPNPIQGGYYDGQYLGYGSSEDVAKRGYTNKITTNAGGGSHSHNIATKGIFVWQRTA